MMRPATRLSLLLTTLVALAATAGPAHAQSSLLSGYGGPGGGEQVVLGSQLLGGGSGGSGGSGSGGSGSAATPPSLAATAPPVAAPAPTGTTTGGATAGGSSSGGSGSGSGGSGSGSATGTTSGGKGGTAGSSGSSSTGDGATPAAAPRLVGAPERVAYPATDSASTLPFSRHDLLLFFGALVALGLIVVAMRALTRWQPGDLGGHA